MPFHQICIPETTTAMPSQKAAAAKKRAVEDEMIDLSATETETETEDEYEATETDDEEDGLESGDEEVLEQSEKKAPETRSVFYLWGSSKAIDNGADKYEVVREGKEFDSVPGDKTPLPDTIQEWSEVRVIETNEFVSAYRVRESSNRNIVRYYVRNGQPQWLEQAKKMLPDKLTSPLTHGILANLSLHLHGIVSPSFKPDEELLKHDDLKNFRLADGKVTHIYDTPYAKKYIHRQKKNAERSAAKKAAAKKSKAQAPEVKVTEEARQPIKVSLPPFPSSPKKSKSKESDAPDESPATKKARSPAKPKSPAKTKSPAKMKPRQLKLGGSPLAPKQETGQATDAPEGFDLETDVPVFKPILPALGEILEQLAVRVVPKTWDRKRKNDSDDSNPVAKKR